MVICKPMWAWYSKFYLLNLLNESNKCLSLYKLWNYSLMALIVKLACLHKDLTFKDFVFVQLTGIDFQLEIQLFLLVTSGLLLLEFCPIKLSCRQREQPTVTNINVIWRPSYIISTFIPWFVTLRLLILMIISIRV